MCPKCICKCVYVVGCKCECVCVVTDPSSIMKDRAVIIVQMECIVEHTKKLYTYTSRHKECQVAHISVYRRDPINGKTFDGVHEHLDHRTSWAPYDEYQRSTRYGRMQQTIDAIPKQRRHRSIWRSKRPKPWRWLDVKRKLEKRDHHQRHGSGCRQY